MPRLKYTSTAEFKSAKVREALRRYPVTVRYSEEDQLYLASTPAFPFVQAHGNTIAEAAKEMQTALTGAVLSLFDRKQPLP